MGAEESEKLFRGIFQSIHTDVNIAAHRQSRLPAYKHRKSAHLFHQPLRKQIRAGLGAKGFPVSKLHFGRIKLCNRLRALIVKTGQRRPLYCFVKADPPQAIQNPVIFIQQIQIAGSAHQFGNQPPLHRVTQLRNTGKGEFCHPFHRQLADPHQPTAG